jgi:hypothetical protein
MMQIELQKPKIIKSCNVDAVVGSYALDRQPLVFENCRERFAVAFQEATTGLYFKHQAAKGIDIANFVSKTEIIIRQGPLSKFSITNRDTILWVEPSQFWKSCPMKRSLFTILLRAASAYNSQTDNYEDAIFSQQYLDPTKKAVIRFLNGFTKYVGPDLKISSTGTVIVDGWKTVFQNKTETEIKKMLVSPNKFFSFYGDWFPSSLWI